MTSHRKGKPGWCDRDTINGCQDQRACIQDDGQSFHPGLLIVLRAVEGQDGIGEGTLQNVSAPHFPIIPEQPPFLDVLPPTIPPKELPCRRTATYPCIQT